MSVTNEHILRELQLLRGDVKRLDAKVDMFATALSNHADRLIELEGHTHATNGHANEGTDS